MAIARSVVNLLGVSDTSGVDIANNGSANNGQIDLLADNISTGVGDVFLKYTGCCTGGAVEIRLIRYPDTGASYATSPVLTYAVSGINGTAKHHLGSVTVGRYIQAMVENRATGAGLEKVYVSLELFKFS